jgi:hypothetical protein
VLGRALGFAAVWLSPAVLLGLAPLLLTDGPRGLWPPLVLAAGACLVAVVLAVPWAALPPGSTLPELAGRRDAGPGVATLPLTAATTASALLFLWAQLAAVRDLARGLGWPASGSVALAVLLPALVVLANRGRRTVAGIGGALAVVGLLVPLAAVLVTTDPVWPRVWAAVASRPRIVFDGEGAWVRAGQPIRGSGRDVVLRVPEAQRVTLLGQGRVRIETPDGAAWTREVSAPIEVALGPGDRLFVPDGFPLRFQAGRSIPGAPRSGPDWAEPGLGPAGWRALAGLAVTLLCGGLGLPAVHGALAAGSATARAARLGAPLASQGLVTVALWGLYAAWLTPEVYLAGVAGSEVYELPGRVTALGAAGPPLRGLALLGLAGGGLAAAVATLAGLPRGRPDLRPVLLVAAGLLTGLLPAGPWPVLLLAFGVAASTSAPATVLACWRERWSPLGCAVGATIGLVAFAGLALVQLAGLAGPPEAGWLGWVAAWPTLAAAPLNVGVAWLLSAGPGPSDREPLPPGLAGLHG